MNISQTVTIIQMGKCHNRNTMEREGIFSGLSEYHKQFNNKLDYKLNLFAFCRLTKVFQPISKLSHLTFLHFNLVRLIK